MVFILYPVGSNLLSPAIRLNLAIVMNECVAWIEGRISTIQMVPLTDLEPVEHDPCPG